MAVVDVSALWVPQHFTGTGSVPGLGVSFTFNAANQKFGWVFQAPKAGSIRKVHFLLGAVTSATDVDVRIETVSTTDGNPTGTLWSANTRATLPAASLVASTWTQSPQLTADATVAKGDMVAAVLTPTGTPNFVLTQYVTGVSGSTRLPYGTSHNGTSWSKSNSLSVFAIEYSDGTFAEMPQTFPISSINTHVFSSSSNPDEYALRFMLPFTARIAGAWCMATTDGDFELVVYDGTTVLSTTTFDKDIRQGTGGGVHYFRLAQPVTLTANTAYRLAIKPTTTTGLTLFSMDVNNAAIMAQLPGGQQFFHSTRVDGGAWTDLQTRRLFMGLMIDGIDTTVTSGGGATPTAYGFA
jgi:hypothetical protein